MRSLIPTKASQQQIGYVYALTRHEAEIRRGKRMQRHFRRKYDCLCIFLSMSMRMHRGSVSMMGIREIRITGCFSVASCMHGLARCGSFCRSPTTMIFMISPDASLTSGRKISPISRAVWKSTNGHNHLEGSPSPSLWLRLIVTRCHVAFISFSLDYPADT